ncbi:hypothetical protein B0T21DRAFT_375408 [Apiosordaria backusii]|uniref:Uncharacterized protein n=1 Tax=Apiosordaria backusii TaxID=314023 RepID=A0AA40AIZ9_9PEZI|nr:hypothetical protein B0T21DRAFT_375408 [Apiosordaria backusii]
MDIDQLHCSSSDPSSEVLSADAPTEGLLTTASYSSGHPSQKLLNNEPSSAHDSSDVDMPDFRPPQQTTKPCDFLGPTAIREPFPTIGQTYMLREPRTGCLLGHTKRRFFLVSPSYNPTSSLGINWRWTFEEIAGDKAMLRLKSPWLEDDGNRWILLDVRRLNPDGKVVVSVDREMKRDVILGKVALRQTSVYKGGKRRRDGLGRVVAELARGHLALDEGGEAIGWEFIRVSG